MSLCIHERDHLNHIIPKLISILIEIYYKNDKILSHNIVVFTLLELKTFN